MKTILIAVLASLALLTGCETVRYVEVKPECDVPPLPVLPSIDWDELSGQGDALARLEAYEAALVDSLIEHREMLKVLCKKMPSEEG